MSIWVSLYFRDLQESSEKVCVVAQTVKNLPAMQETWVGSLAQEYPPEKDQGTQQLNRSSHVTQLESGKAGVGAQVACTSVTALRQVYA